MNTTEIRLSDRMMRAVDEGDTELVRLLNELHGNLLKHKEGMMGLTRELDRERSTSSELRAVIAWMVSASPTDDAFRVWDEYSDAYNIDEMRGKYGEPVMNIPELAKKWGWA